MKNRKKKALIVVPAQTGKGGVFNFYENLKIYLPATYDLYYLNGTLNSGGLKKTATIFNHFRSIFRNLNTKEYSKVILNPSLNLNSVLRDSLVAMMSNLLGVEVVVFWRGWNFKNEKFLKFPFSIITSYLLKPKNTLVLYSKISSSLKKLGFKGNVFLMTTLVNNDAFKYEINDKIKSLKIIFLSRVENYKGVFELLEAYKVLKQKHNNISLTIAGSGSALPEVKKTIKTQKIKDVNVPGYVVGTKKYELLAGSNIFIFPSYSEGMPNAVLESMAIGLPVITTKVGGLNDFFEDKKMGYFIEIKNANSIVKTLEEVIYNNEIISEIKQYNINFAKTHFRCNHVAKKFINTIEAC